MKISWLLGAKTQYSLSFSSVWIQPLNCRCCICNKMSDPLFSFDRATLVFARNYPEIWRKMVAPILHRNLPTGWKSAKVHCNILEERDQIRLYWEIWDLVCFPLYPSFFGSQKIQYEESSNVLQQTYRVHKDMKQNRTRRDFILISLRLAKFRFSLLVCIFIHETLTPGNALGPVYGKMQ